MYHVDNGTPKTAKGKASLRAICPDCTREVQLDYYKLVKRGLRIFTHHYTLPGDRGELCAGSACPAPEQ